MDTPGLGSLATSGAEETVAYLPRCDLGLVLVDAASTLTHEDLATVQALCQSGARAMVLGSKADLLRPAERQETLAYAQQQIKAQLGLEVPVRLVSVMGAEARLCDEWFERELKPLLESHREQAAASLKAQSRRAARSRVEHAEGAAARPGGRRDGCLPGASRRGHHHAAQSRRLGGGC